MLIVATKAVGLEEALERVEAIGEPELVLPLLNGLDHLAVLRRRFSTQSVLAGAIRVESDRSEPGVIVHSSPFLLIDMAARDPSRGAALQALGDELERADFPVRLGYPITDRSEAEVMWSKLVRLNALACTTSAHDKLLGEIRDTPRLRAELVGAIEEACAVAQAEGASEIDPRAGRPGARACARDAGELDAAGYRRRAGARARRDPGRGPAGGVPTRPRVPDDRSARPGDPSADRGWQPRLNRSGPRAPVRSPRGCGAGASRRGSPGWRSPRRPPAPRPQGVLVLAVAEHPEVAGNASVGVDRDPGKDLLALLEPEPLHVEVGEPDAVGGMGGVLAIVGRHGLRESLEVLGDLPRVRHRSPGA